MAKEALILALASVLDFGIKRIPMQISTNPTMRETSLLYQTTQKQQENTTSFDMLLSLQSNQANSYKGVFYFKV